MDLVLDSLLTALTLIFTLDRDVFSIAGRTILIAGSSTLIATLIFIPVGSLIYFHDFPGKGALVYVIQTLYSVPTVFVGLLVFITLSKDGPLGNLGLLFTPQAIVIGHVVLISPIVTGLTVSALRGVAPEIKDTALSLGANRLQTIFTIVREAKYGVSTAVLLAFGRAFPRLGWL